MDSRRYLLDSSFSADGRGLQKPVYNHSIPECHVSMRDPFSFAATLETQHFRLVTVRRDYKTLPLDYASFQVDIDIGHLTQDIEILEQGRGLL